MPPEKDPKRYTTLESKLYLENLGVMEIHAEVHTYSEPEIEVKVWSIPKSKYLWTGSTGEFWDLILSGIEIKRLMSPCPKCSGTNRDHAPNCPLIQLAKKEIPECSQS